MRRMALGIFLIALAIHAQPELLTHAPALIAKCAPQYTSEARQAGIEGTVTLHTEVYADGRAHNIRVLSGLGWGLDEKAIAAVKQWRFSPGMKYGKTIVAPAKIEVNFRIDESSEPCGAAPSQMESKPQRKRA